MLVHICFTFCSSTVSASQPDVLAVQKVEKHIYSASSAVHAATVPTLEASSEEESHRACIMQCAVREGCRIATDGALHTL